MNATRSEKLKDDEREAWEEFRLAGVGPAEAHTNLAYVYTMLDRWTYAEAEYGTVVFISGNMPLRTETVPFLILARLEQYDYAGAKAVAVLMLLFAAGLLLAVGALQREGRAPAPAHR